MSCLKTDQEVSMLQYVCYISAEKNISIIIL